MTAPMGRGQIDHPANIAAGRLDDLDPRYVARVRDDLQAGPITRVRVMDAIHELAGLGHVVEETAVVEEIEGQWFGGGRTPDGRSVFFPLDDQSAPDIQWAIKNDGDDLPVVLVPPTNLMDLPEGAL